MRSCEFKTSEASTKAWYRTKGIIDQYLNILDTGKFRKQTKRLSDVANKRYGIEGKLFLEEDGGAKALPNTFMFGQIDKAKGINYGQKEKMINDSDYEEESMNVFEEKVKLLKQNMNVEVILDSDVTSSMVLPVSDKRTVAAGKPVILINPNQVFKTTAIHEFAHIFIDAFPKGLDNPRIIQALSQLEGTKLWEDVKSAYPELSEDMLKKEVLATAMGRAGSDIWDSRNNAKEISIFEAFKNWVYSFLQRTFGISKNEVNLLVEQMLDKRVEQDLMENLSDIAQEQRFIKDGEVVKEAMKVEKLNKAIFSKISNIFELYKPDTKAKKDKEASLKVEAMTKKEKTSFERLAELKDLLEKYEKTDSIAGIVKYISWSKSQVKAMESRINRLKDKGALTSDVIQDFKAYNSAMDLITDVQRTIMQMYSAKEISESKRDNFIKSIKGLTSDREVINDSLLTAQREIYAVIMMNNSNQHEVEFYKHYEKQWESIKPEEDKIPWIRRMMQENKEMIDDRVYEFYLGTAEKSIKDLDSLSSVFINEKNLNSTEIQVISKMLDYSDMITTQFALENVAIVKKDYEAFSADNPGMNTEKKYEKLIETNEAGEFSLVSQYRPEFYAEYSRMINLLNDSELYNEAYKDVTYNKTTYNLNGVEKKFNLGKEVKIEGDNVIYKVKGVIKSTPLKEAVAISEFREWKDNNTKKEKSAGIIITTPSYKWESEKYKNLSSSDLDHLNRLIVYAREADNLYEGNTSLVKKAFNSSWISLPGVTRSTMERLIEGHAGSAVYDKFTDMFKRKDDEFDIAESKDSTSAFKKVFADINNKEKLNVPIPYRVRLKGTEQSMDLHTIFFMNLEAAKNYEQKKKIESQLLTVVDVMGNRLVPDYVGMGNLLKAHGFSKKGSEIELHRPKDQLPNDVKKALDMIENRLYGIKEKDAGEIAGINIQKATSTYLKYAGSVALIGNYLNSIVNATSGTVSNLIEAMGGETYTMKDWAVAKKKYWSDTKAIITDIGSNVQTSRTNVFMNYFNVMGGENALNNKFENESKAMSLMSMDSLKFLDHGGEHMMQAQTMYAVMNSIKVLNKDGKFIDSNGMVVSEENAATLDEVISFSTDGNGNMSIKLADFVDGTTHTPLGRDKILLETKGLIKKKIIDLYGVYDSNLKSAAQREWWGKLMFFLRKWIESSTMRRWRGLAHVAKNSEDLRDVDKFYSEDLKQHQEGYYITALRFMGQVVKGLKNGQMDIIKLQGKKLSKHEIANIRKFGAEVGMMALTLLAYMAMGGMDDEPDEETLIARYLLRRELSEMAFYMAPTEALKVASTPSATIGVTKRLLDLMGQLLSPLEQYEQGTYEGQSKLKVKIGKATPAAAGLIYKDVETSLRWLQNE